MARPDPIAQALRMHLSRRKMTVTELAARAELSRSTVTAWLNGHRSVTVASLAKLLRAADRLKSVTDSISKHP